VTTIERALDSDRTAIESLLVASGLPLDGLEIALPTFFVARDDGSVVGCAGFERYGPAGLLRSVCVAPELRGTGVGRELVDAAEQLAVSVGVSELFLLTETAEAWFPRLGYASAARTSVPASLTASPEFTSVCPDTAAVLRKTLRPLLVAAAPPRDDGMSTPTAE
jgi:amino-acid N-acetyltransferase